VICRLPGQVRAGFGGLRLERMLNGGTGFTRRIERGPCGVLRGQLGVLGGPGVCVAHSAAGLGDCERGGVTAATTGPIASRCVSGWW